MFRALASMKLAHDSVNYVKLIVYTFPLVLVFTTLQTNDRLFCRLLKFLLPQNKLYLSHSSPFFLSPSLYRTYFACKLLSTTGYSLVHFLTVLSVR